jgi:pentatricopeptide repeat protein
LLPFFLGLQRLYGSGESDVAFFDLAVDRFLKNAGLFADVDIGGRLLDAGGFKPSAFVGAMRSVNLTRSNDDPLLQSARVHRKLKTIVPPEPTGEGLPSSNGAADDVPGATPSRNSRKLQALQIMEKHKGKYTYSVFPSEFQKALFGSPRPLPAVVIAEFDRQRKDAARFRRKNRTQLSTADAKKHITRASSAIDPVIPPSPEVATFTVFFMAFGAIVGKELMEFDFDQSEPERMILSSYVPTTAGDGDCQSEMGESEGGMAGTAATEDETADYEEAFLDAQEREDVTELKASRPDMGGMFGDEDEEGAHRSSGTQPPSVADYKESKPFTLKSSYSPLRGKREPPDLNGARNGLAAPDISDDRSERTEKSTKTAGSDGSAPRSRFRDKLSKLQIEEAKAKGRAQLGLAFEMLTMMKKRGLRSDPEAYQTLIDACGRVGDTKRATDLLALMHEDGIVGKYSRSITFAAATSA